jgi:hypothetical protein
VIIDCSASNDVADHYADWLAQASTSSRRTSRPAPVRLHATIRDARASGGARWRYEATVGAGLPVILHLRDLIDTGDELTRSKASSPARSPTCSTASTAAAVLGTGARGAGSWAIPNRIHAMTCRASMWRASW